MRYRAFGLFNQNVSSIGVSLANPDKKLRHKRDLLIAGLEAGINLYEVDSSDFEAAKALGQAVDSLERAQFLFGLRVRAYSRLATAATVLDLVQEVTDQANLEFIDYLMLEIPARGAISADLLKGATEAKSRRMVRFIGMAGYGPGEYGANRYNTVNAGLFYTTKILGCGLNLGYTKTMHAENALVSSTVQARLTKAF